MVGISHSWVYILREICIICACKKRRESQSNGVCNHDIRTLPRHSDIRSPEKEYQEPLKRQIPRPEAQELPFQHTDLPGRSPEIHRRLSRILWYWSHAKEPLGQARGCHDHRSHRCLVHCAHRFIPARRDLLGIPRQIFIFSPFTEFAAFPIDNLPSPDGTHRLSCNPLWPFPNGERWEGWARPCPAR